MDLITIFILGVVVLNSISFFVLALDKKAATKNKRRFSEGSIFFLATSFGAIGVYSGMIIFNHKIKKWYFFFGIPILITQNIISFYYVLNAIQDHIGILQ